MKTNILKISFCFFCLLIIPATSRAAVTITHNIGATDTRQKLSHSGQSVMLLPAGGITEQLRSEVLSQTAPDAKGTVAHDIQVVGNGITAAVAALIGFLCITLVRDRKVWAALAYMIVIHPVIVEARQLDHLVRTVRLDNHIAFTVGLSSLHNSGLPASTSGRNQSWLHPSAVLHRSAVDDSGHIQIQILSAIINHRLYPEDTVPLYFEPVHTFGVSEPLFTTNILSRPPPAVG
jgi:hypothetical protein